MATPSPSFRKPTDAPGTLVLDSGRTVTCVVRNLSLGGAKVEMQDEADVGGPVRLVAEELGLDAEAELVWRIGAEMGVRFTARLRSMRLVPRRPAAPLACNDGTRISLAAITAGQSGDPR